MKDRTNDFKDYAWEICRQYKCSSEAAAVEVAIRKGYSMGIKDSTELLSAAYEQLKAERSESNKPK